MPVSDRCDEYGIHAMQNYARKMRGSQSERENSMGPGTEQTKIGNTEDTE